jgi:riboflavin synthase
MFTGLVQEIATITRLQRTPHGLKWTIEAPQCAPELNLGDSINVAGACQSAESIDGSAISGTAIGETLKKTTYEHWTVGTKVNLELPLRLGDRLGGHIVSGHVDTVGKVVSHEETAANWTLTVSFPGGFARWVIAQGSVTLDGVSLTIARRTNNTLTVALIPETVKRTTLGSLRIGDSVNIEFDQMIKAAVQAVEMMSNKSEGVTERTLTEAGW